MPYDILTIDESGDRHDSSSRWVLARETSIRTDYPIGKASVVPDLISVTHLPNPVDEEGGEHKTSEQELRGCPDDDSSSRWVLARETSIRTDYPIGKASVGLYLVGCKSSIVSMSYRISSLLLTCQTRLMKKVVNIRHPNRS
jgi:hypothetical protein